MRPNGTFQLLAGGIEAFVPRYVYTVGAETVTRERKA
jgi:hypothetical protein